MHLYINLGLPFAIHFGRVFVFETDFRGVVFIRVAGLGQAWLERGLEPALAPWREVRS